MDTALYGRGLHPFEGYEARPDVAEIYSDEAKRIVDETGKHQGALSSYSEPFTLIPRLNLNATEEKYKTMAMQSTPMEAK